MQNDDLKCHIAGEKFGDESLARVVNAENAQVDDLSVVRDGDHLFLLPSLCEGIESDDVVSKPVIWKCITEK